MPDRGQVVRFAVGSAAGPRSRTWRLWVPRGKSDVYVSGRRLGNSVKVSLHEPGPARFALTREFVSSSGYQAPEGMDARLAIEWERPRPKPPRQVARPLSIIVPWDEVLDLETTEQGNVAWTEPPPEGTCINFDLVYIPAGVTVVGHPGARSMWVAHLRMAAPAQPIHQFLVHRAKALSEQDRQSQARGGRCSGGSQARRKLVRGPGSSWCAGHFLTHPDDLRDWAGRRRRLVMED